MIQFIRPVVFHWTCFFPSVSNSNLTDQQSNCSVTQDWNYDNWKTVQNDMRWEKHSVLVVVCHHAGTRIIIFGQWPHLVQTWRVSDMKDLSQGQHQSTSYSKQINPCQLTWSLTFQKPWKLVKKWPAFSLWLTHPLPPLSVFSPLIELATTPHTFPSLNCHRIFSFILRVSCQSLCLHALLDKSKTPSRLRVCVPVCFLRGLRCSCVWRGDKKKVTASSGPDSEVGIAAGVCVRQSLSGACVTTLWWWQLRSNWKVQCFVPSWCPCHFVVLFPSLNFPEQPARGAAWVGWIFGEVEASHRDLRDGHCPLCAFATVKSRALGNFKIREPTSDTFE